ncbi:phosphorylase [Terrihabitans sp. PJ23]|uniref:Phosphorylase n=1 Tax=Terrihabitans rhizophilus TaxID=3092662 RepID=A0ABU4RJW4_9HYPH|nr:phosphorylase [Terrihabitans sp. PJ23]
MSPTVCDVIGDRVVAQLPPVLVVTGVAREARIATGSSVETICSGGAPARLREILRERPAPACRAVVSFGVAGGLDPDLNPGDIVLATKVTADAAEWVADSSLLATLHRALQVDPRLRVVQAPLAGVDLALVDASSKRVAYEMHGAAAVDMESHIAAEYAARHGLPFAAIRVVCDPATRGLPPLVTSALKPDGAISLAGVFGSLARQPGQIVDLIRLSRDASRAFKSLGCVPLNWAPLFA